MKFYIIRYISILVFISILNISCDYLDQTPKQNVEDEIVFKDEKGFNTAINGLYRLMKGRYYGGGMMAYYGGLYPMMADLSSDIAQSIGTYNVYISLDTYNATAAEFDGTGEYWQAAYKLINQANTIISEAKGSSSIDTSLKDSILGQAYFIRALAYFDLNRSFGGVEGVYGTLGVPLVLSPTRSIDEIDYPGRATINEVYQQVETDLLETLQLLDSVSDLPSTRVSESAAKALLSRLYLYYKQDYSLVEHYATEVIDAYGNLASIDKIYEGGSTESIFELESNSVDFVVYYRWYSPAGLGGRKEFVLHQEFVDFMLSRPDDKRNSFIVKNENDNTYYPFKYQTSSGGDNVQILRLAEMYLNRAEARVKKDLPDLTGAIDDINEIRNRAGLNGMTGLSAPDDILDVLEKERLAEFYEEGHRWFDLIRTDRAMDVLVDITRERGPNVTITDKGQYVWPIPEKVLTNSRNNILQNEYYRGN